MYHHDHPAENIYFIKKGLALLTWDEYDGVPVSIFDEGSIIGELEVYKNSPRLFTCWAVTDLDLLVLTKKDFKRIFFQNFPNFGHKHLIIMDRAFEALEGVMQMVVDFLLLEESNVFGISTKNEASPIPKSPRVKNTHYIHQYLKSFTGRPNQRKWEKGAHTEHFQSRHSEQVRVHILEK